MSIKAVKRDHVTQKQEDENQILPSIHISPQQHVQVFSESQSFLYK